LSVRQLAALAGVSNPYLSQVERGLRRPSAEVLQQIAKGLRISAEVLYVRAGILEEHQRLDVEIAIHADPLLNDRQKRVLLDIYTTFRSENARTASEDEAAAADDAASADGWVGEESAGIAMEEGVDGDIGEADLDAAPGTLDPRKPA
jgi:transcriptional regulator with XRE-family HTH domain